MAMYTPSHSTATLRIACTIKITIFDDLTAPSRITTTRTRSASAMRCGLPPCNSCRASICINSTFDSRVHYPGVFRQDLYPCVLTKIFLLACWRILSSVGVSGMGFAWVVDLPQPGFLETFLSSRMLYPCVLQIGRLFCCRLFSPIGFIGFWQTHAFNEA